MPKIHFFCAGGTIDKVYFDAKSDYQIGQPAVEKILKELPVFFDYDNDGDADLLSRSPLPATEADNHPDVP